MQHVSFEVSTPVYQFSDPFGIGQIACAKIAAECAQELMGDAAESAFSTGYVPDQVRAARRATFYKARAEYERAMLVIEQEKKQ